MPSSPTAASTTTSSSSAGTARTEWTGGRHPEPLVVAHHADAVGPALGVLVVEPALDTLERHVDAAAQVAGVEQGEPDAGGPARLAQRLPHRVGVAVAGPARTVVQVVELPD